MQFLRTGVTYDSNGEQIQATAGFKLDRAAIESMYPQGELASVDWQDKLGTGRYGMVGAEGLHPNLVAEMFGFTSGDE
ncbi:hypothetical protein, partial [Streptococcus pneumoniae]|uniref:hypothetical protein n=1 Tax=Streptococcus pneumoniae TaxID=1313 RepID=UPI0018B0C295